MEAETKASSMWSGVTKRIRKGSIEIEFLDGHTSQSMC